MFETLRRTQPQIADLLSSQIAQGNLPRAMLFSGPAFSGRLHASYELAAQLGSLRDGAFALSATRDFRSRIKFAIAAFRGSPGLATRGFLRENLSCYLAQFNGLLATDEKDQKQYDRAGEIREMLEELDEVAMGGIERFCARLETAFEATAKVMGSLRQASRLGLLNIAQARALKRNLHLTSMGKSDRVVVIEGLEDANESTKNSLLKLLEEPPEKARLILISSRPERILPTILSRARRYHFPALGAEAKGRLLSSLGILDESPERSLEERFLDSVSSNLPQMRKLAAGFFAGKEIDLPSLFKMIEGGDGVQVFLKALADGAEARRRAGGLSPLRAKRALDLINGAAAACGSYNQNTRLACEALLYRLREEL